VAPGGLAGGAVSVGDQGSCLFRLIRALIAVGGILSPTRPIARIRICNRSLTPASQWYKRALGRASRLQRGDDVYCAETTLMVRPAPRGRSFDKARQEQSGVAQIAQLFGALRPDLLRFASWLARDASVAEDIVQEAMLRAWRSRAALKNPGAARPWLLTIVRREHARLYQRKRLELVSLDKYPGAENIAAPEGPDGEVRRLRQEILKLPIEYREPLTMQVLGGFSTGEIARELDLSLTAVLTRLFRARNKLRATYGPASVAEKPIGTAQHRTGGDPAGRHRLISAQRRQTAEPQRPPTSLRCRALCKCNIGPVEPVSSLEG
jgi:RNA polymerase sigma-70 factor, ECF subfamily